MSWVSVIIAGLITYFTRFSMITFVNSKMMSKKVRLVLSYVPSTVFPSELGLILFPPHAAASLQPADVRRKV